MQHVNCVYKMISNCTGTWRNDTNTTSLGYYVTPQ